ncbi:MAG: hypothetical protein K2H56_03560 [Malacoplasma sp.]|nr:hypothetical protein [Malacoplasma sp.]MDE5774967.1 hypothetical protein [Malacoplasma sp.]MDE7099828.1 hypothetical protein [Malacoplasma sp.]
MHINKVFKKIIKPVLLFCPIVCIPIFSAACATPPVYSTGDVISNGYLKIKCNKFEYKKINNDLEIKVSFTFISTNHFKLDIKELNENEFIHLNFQAYTRGIQTNKIKNMELNGFDFFKQELIRDELTYAFVFDIKSSILEQSMMENKDPIWLRIFLLFTDFSFLLEL